MTFYVLNVKKISKIFLYALLIFTIFFTALLIDNKILATGEKRDLPIYCVNTEKKVVALSFDAAWGADDTNDIINILKKYNAPATFFLVSKWAEKYPAETKALFNAGHAIENHSATHPHMGKLSPEQIKNEINTCNETIKKITGITPTLFRPPYGDYSNTLVKTIREMGMYTIQWDVDSLDWMNVTAEQIAVKVVKKVKCGSIILFHNDAKNTPAALPIILERLKADGYEFVKINDLIIKENYIIDHTGMQIKK